MKKYLAYIVIGIGFIMFLAIIYTSLYNNLFNSPNNVFEANNTTIQLLLLITSIITILFLAINFKQQKDQNRVSVIESNYNRVITIIYQQIEHTLKRFKPINGVSPYGYYSTYLFDFSSKLDWEDKGGILLKVQRIQQYKTLEHLDMLFKFLKSELSLYKSVINGNGFEDETKKRLVQLVCWNIDPLLEKTTKDFQKLYIEFKNTYQEQILKSELKYQEMINNIENNLDEVIKFIDAEF